MRGIFYSLKLAFCFFRISLEYRIFPDFTSCRLVANHFLLLFPHAFVVPERGGEGGGEFLSGGGGRNCGFSLQKRRNYGMIILSMALRGRSLEADRSVDKIGKKWSYRYV